MELPVFCCLYLVCYSGDVTEMSVDLIASLTFNVSVRRANLGPQTDIFKACHQLFPENSGRGL